MRTATWAQIEDDVRVRMDLPVFSTATKPTGAQLMRMGNQSIQARDAILSEIYGDDYRTNVDTLATVADLDMVSLPSDFVKLRDLLWLRETDAPVRLRRASLEDIERLSLLTARSWSDVAPCYRFIGSSAIQVLPTPNAAYSLRLYYVQSTDDITLATDTIQDGPGWSEWIVADLCVKISMLREEDPSVYLGMRADAERRIRSQAPDRDEADPYSVRDVTGESRRIGTHELRDLVTRYG